MTVERRNEMRRGMWIAVIVLVALVAVAVGIGAYNAGMSQGLEETGRAGEVVRVVGPGYGVFPFGFVFPLLFFFLIFFLIRGAFWGRRWGPGGHHWESRERAIEDLHRRLHQRETTERSPGDTGTA
jgi:uncharacterized membrane protein